jgi:hypothetical protein
MTTDQLILVPEEVLEVLLASDAPWGYFAISQDPYEGLVIVRGYSAGHGTRYNTPSPFVAQHYMNRYDLDGWHGAWYRVPIEAHQHWEALRRTQSAYPASWLEQQVQGWRAPGASPMPVLTIAVDAGQPDIRAWFASTSHLEPVAVATVPAETDQTRSLEPGWPAGVVADALFTVVGVGSIGSAAVRSLMSYGARRLVLVDPDRLLPHNLVRHGARRRWLGCTKVRAVAETTLEHYPYAEIEQLPLDVIDDADVMRPLFRQSDVVICCVDGIEPRATTSHLCRWAQTPQVLACVLDDGAYGELLRLRPGVTVGCLQCQRMTLREGGQLDPEPGIDRPYGTGSRHRPMTAVGGDLAIVGDLAAKAAVGTLLESRGLPDQRLAGDHGIIALRGQIDTAKPFDMPLAGMVRWRAGSAPRNSCPTCGGLP